LISLDVDFSRIVTRGTLESALDLAMRRAQEAGATPTR